MKKVANVGEFEKGIRAAHQAISEYLNERIRIAKFGAPGTDTALCLLRDRMPRPETILEEAKRAEAQAN